MKKITNILLLLGTIILISLILYLYFAQSKVIKELEKEVNDAKSKVVTQEKIIKEVRIENDNRVKEAVNDVFEENIDMPDDKLDDSWSEFIQGVYQRNNQRRNERNNNR